MLSTAKEVKEKTGYLKRSDLYTIGVGQAIGSGVLTLIGPAILLTGQSAWLAYRSCMYLGIYDDRTDPVDHIHTETWRGLLFSGRRYGRQTSSRYVCGWIFTTDD